MESRVASARGGGNGAIESLDNAAEERRGESGCCRWTTSSSKQTLRRSSTGESANVTVFVGSCDSFNIATGAILLAEIPFTPFEQPFTPLAYGGGHLYGGAFIIDIDGFIDLE